ILSRTGKLNEILRKKGLIAGIRAEHIFPAPEKEPTHELEAINVEQLGNETIISIEIGTALWTDNWPFHCNTRVRERVPVHISIENISFFDTESGLLLKSATTGKGLTQEVQVV